MKKRKKRSPSPDPSLSRLDQQLARLRQTINTRAAYNERKSEEWRERSRVSDHVFSHAITERVTPERDSGVSKHVQGEDDSSGTLSDISNYITRLEAVQNRLTDLLNSRLIKYTILINPCRSTDCCTI